MGRAQITHDHGAGRYTVELEYDRSAADARLLQLTGEEAQLEAQLPVLDAAIAQKLAVEAAASQALQDLILELTTAYQTGAADAEIARIRKEIEDAVAHLSASHAEVVKAYGAKQEVTLRLAGVQKQIAALQGRLVVPTVPITCWCADYTEGLTGQVGTIEVGRVGPQAPALPILRPGGGYDAARDGRLVQTASMTPEAAFHAFAMLPGAGRWRPRYRVGEITSIDPGTGRCGVALDPTRSPPAAGRRWNTNAAPSLANVPIDYMSTPMPGPFEVGDRVVVELRNTANPNTAWNDPWIIGFEAEPKPVTGMQPEGPFRWLYDGYELAAPGWMTPPIEWHIGQQFASGTPSAPWLPVWDPGYWDAVSAFFWETEIGGPTSIYRFLVQQWMMSGLAARWLVAQPTDPIGGSYSSVNTGARFGFTPDPMDPRVVAWRSPLYAAHPPPAAGNVKVRTPVTGITQYAPWGNHTALVWDSAAWYPRTTPPAAPDEGVLIFTTNPLVIRARDALGRAYYFWGATMPVRMELMSGGTSYSDNTDHPLQDFFPSDYVEVVASQYTTAPARLQQDGIVWNTEADATNPGAHPKAVAFSRAFGVDNVGTRMDQSLMSFDAQTWFVRETYI